MCDNVGPADSGPQLPVIRRVPASHTQGVGPVWVPVRMPELLSPRPEQTQRLQTGRFASLLVLSRRHLAGMHVFHALFSIIHTFDIAIFSLNR